MRRKKLIDEPLLMVLNTLRERLYLPDPTPFYCVLAAVIANRKLKGPALQFMLIGPPSCGGTELLMMLEKTKGMHYVSRLTQESLLSGTARKEMAKGARGGVLREVERGDVLVLKDFTSILAMRQEPRTEVLGALREVGDGRWDKPVGTDGGRTLRWEGKVGILTKCTFAIDQHMREISMMGDRFLYYRYPMRNDDYHAATMAIQSHEDGGWDKSELQEMVSVFIEDICGREDDDDGVADIGRASRDKLAAMASLCARARAGVERDWHSKDIVYYDDAERAPRLSLYFALMYKALRTIGVVEAETWRVLRQIAISTMHGAKGLVLHEVMRKTRLDGGGGVTVSEMLRAIGNKRETTIRRMLEELEAHNVLCRVNGNGNGHYGGGVKGAMDHGMSDTWKFTQEAALYWHKGWVG